MMLRGFGNRREGTHHGGRKRPPHDPNPTCGDAATLAVRSDAAHQALSTMYGHLTQRTLTAEIRLHRTRTALQAYPDARPSPRSPRSAGAMRGADLPTPPVISEPVSSPPE